MGDDCPLLRILEDTEVAVLDICCQGFDAFDKTFGSLLDGRRSAFLKGSRALAQRIKESLEQQFRRLKELAQEPAPAHLLAEADVAALSRPSAQALDKQEHDLDVDIATMQQSIEKAQAEQQAVAAEVAQIKRNLSAFGEKRAAQMAATASVAAVAAGGKENLEATVNAIQNGVAALQPMLQSLERWNEDLPANHSAAAASPAICTKDVVVEKMVIQHKAAVNSATTADLRALKQALQAG